MVFQESLLKKTSQANWVLFEHTNFDVKDALRFGKPIVETIDKIIEVYTLHRIPVESI